MQSNILMVVNVACKKELVLLAWSSALSLYRSAMDKKRNPYAGPNPKTLSKIFLVPFLSQNHRLFRICQIMLSLADDYAPPDIYYWNSNSNKISHLFSDPKWNLDAFLNSLMYWMHQLILMKYICLVTQYLLASKFRLGTYQNFLVEVLCLVIKI